MLMIQMLFIIQEVVEEIVEEEVVHEDNDWGISLVDEDAGEATTSTQPTQQLAEGITTAYELPSTSTTEDQDETPAADDTSLEELMKQMKSM